jgi:type VI protein secretion system component Hcp
MYDAFLKLIMPDGRQLRGESLDPFHAGWIDVESLSIAVPSMATHEAPANDAAGYGPLAGQSATLTKPVCMASPALVLACATGQEFGSAVVEIIRGGPDAQRVICRFEGVMVGSVLPVQGLTHDGLPREQVRIDYRKVGFSHGPAGIARLVGGGAAAAAAVLRAAMGK